MNPLINIVNRNRAGHPLALASVCSAQADVLDATLSLAAETGHSLLIEATSNQSNQFGGYTGMKPADFIASVRARAAHFGLNAEKLLFGGDHLGPQVWRKEPAAAAMAKAHDMMRAYVEAGFTKIHLDCSEGCLGEADQVDDETCAARSAELAATCEKYAPEPDKLVYVIGTEVPPPGGARADHEDAIIEATSPERAQRTIKIHQRCFQQRGLDAAWSRVVALVVQPGLEFAPARIDHFPIQSEDHLSRALDPYPGLAFEAHSTDYQSAETYQELARRHFVVLKVGPALTFAYRQAIYALDHIAGWLSPSAKGQPLPQVMEQLMRENPDPWIKHYNASGQELTALLHFSYADRIRYYWPAPEAQSALESLFERLEPLTPPRPLLEQYFAPEVLRRSGQLKAASGFWAQDLVRAQIQCALAPYLLEDAV